MGSYEEEISLSEVHQHQSTKHTREAGCKPCGGGVSGLRTEDVSLLVSPHRRRQREYWDQLWRRWWWWSLCVQHFGPDWNISVTTGQRAVMFCKEINSHERWILQMICSLFILVSWIGRDTFLCDEWHKVKNQAHILTRHVRGRTQAAQEQQTQAPPLSVDFLMKEHTRSLIIRSNCCRNIAQKTFSELWLNYCIKQDQERSEDPEKEERKGNERWRGGGNYGAGDVWGDEWRLLH